MKIYGGRKSGTVVDLLGCSVGDFKKHIEAQWSEKMNWDNHGTYWHIDHIRPLVSFDMTITEEQFKAFHFSNTQPLIALDNLRKGGRWDSGEEFKN